MGKNNFKQHAVMVVDDTESDIDILVECLSDTYRVRVAMDGPSALESLQKDPPDIILLDIMMPGMDGYEVCRRIMQDENTKEILVIFVTSLSDSDDETRGFELGAVDYIAKPYNFSVIRARVKTHLELAEARKELQRQNAILKENVALRELFEQISRHDLKNPLQVILNTAEMLAFEIPLEKYGMDEFVQNQVDSCYTMLNMINHSLDLYKMEIGTYPLNLKQMDILPLLDRVVVGVRDIIQAMELKVVVEINGRLRASNDRFILLCDNLLFYSMMSNLIKNAAEASPKGERLLISLWEDEYKNIHIQNQGAVSPEIRNRFFEKFVTFGKYGGSGLGTYSARLMAEIQGGKINILISDEEDKTTIEISFPNFYSSRLL